MVNVTSLLAKAGSGVGFSFGVKAWTEMEIRCVKGMHKLKLISSENNAGFKEDFLETLKTFWKLRNCISTGTIRTMEALGACYSVNEDGYQAGVEGQWVRNLPFTHTS